MVIIETFKLMKDKIWTRSPLTFANVSNDNRHFILHPKIAELVHEFDAKKLLDHGCGDGVMNLLINKSVEIGLHDINKEILQVASENLKYYNHRVFIERGEIPKGYYDVSISSNVLMTIDNEEEYLNVLSDLKNSVKQDNGKVIIGITHPCFRQFDFSTFKTEFTNGSVFNYFEEGKRFSVFLKKGNESSDDFVEFADFHYSLSYTINKALSVGLTLEKMIELPDKSTDQQFFNFSFAPFIVLIFKV